MFECAIIASRSGLSNLRKTIHAHTVGVIPSVEFSANVLNFGCYGARQIAMVTVPIGFLVSVADNLDSDEEAARLPCSVVVYRRPLISLMSVTVAATIARPLGRSREEFEPRPPAHHFSSALTAGGNSNKESASGW